MRAIGVIIFGDGANAYEFKHEFADIFVGERRNAFWQGAILCVLFGCACFVVANQHRNELT